MNAKPSLPYRLLPELAELSATRSLSGVLPCERADLGLRDLGFESGISYELVLTNTGDGVLLTGTARAKVVTECARCLETVTFELEGEVEGYFILSPDEHDQELSDDEFTAIGPDGQVDLAAPVLAAVIYELPQVVLCRDDCAGLCPTCGTNLNEQRCDCAEETGGDSPFAVLKELIQPE
jgi:uncharacterized protein